MGKKKKTKLPSYKCSTLVCKVKSEINFIYKDYDFPLSTLTMKHNMNRTLQIITQLNLYQHMIWFLIFETIQIIMLCMRITSSVDSITETENAIHRHIKHKIKMVNVYLQLFLYFTLKNFRGSYYIDCWVMRWNEEWKTKLMEYGHFISGNYWEASHFLCLLFYGSRGICTFALTQ